MRILLLIIALACAVIASGQYKIAHLNTAELLDNMPAALRADTVLNKMARQMEQQKRKMQAEMQQKIALLQEQQDTLPEAIFISRYSEIQDLEKRIQAFTKSAQEELASKQEELYGPILDSIEQAIQAVAKEKGYKYVLEEGAGVILYSEESDNIMNLVRQKLGLPPLNAE